MQAKLGDCVLVVGNATKDGEMKLLGEKNTPNTKWGLAVGKDKDGGGIFANCEAWGRLANVAKDIKKGDIVMVVGKVETHEYNEKTYKTLVAEWVSICGKTTAPAKTDMPQLPTDSNGFVPFPEDDDDLPF